ncbi:hypothetical protein V8G54_029190 [Vigna mungo]|uniref:Uncharacterized protein n=1 Tax=Vigna mungo TaxID=3915 RepID=A0AAQ3MUD9_VIGMU
MGGFEVRSVFIPFTKLDVCLGLGVRVNGEMFKLFKEEVDCHIRRLFDTIDESVHNVYEQLQKRIKGDEVADGRDKKDHTVIWLVVYLHYRYILMLVTKNKLAKTKSSLAIILHWMHVKVGEAEVEKAFSSNEVITKVYVRKEEMSIEIVKEALDGHHNAKVKDNLHRRSIADIVSENEALRAIIVDQEVSIAKLKKVVEKLQMFRAKKRKRKEDYILGDDFRSRILQKDNQIVLYGVGKSNSEKGSDIFRDVVGKFYIEKTGDVLGDEEMDMQKSDMYTCLKAQPRKRVKSVSLKTPWTRLDRKNRSALNS